MKSIVQYILEKEEKEEAPQLSRGDIKFTIWEEPDKKVTRLKDNFHYQKIEYKLQNHEDNLSIDFLLGFQEESWKLWIGKIGSCSYDDDPYCSFNTDNFNKAILMALDKIEEFIIQVSNDKENYVQYYIQK